MYSGPCSVRLDERSAAGDAQTGKDEVMTRKIIRDAFHGLVVEESV
jgi:hypothetical protein